MANSILSTIKEEARGWTILGIAILIFYPVVIFNWDAIKYFNIIIPLSILGVGGTSIWWAWTMRIIFQLLKLREEEATSFGEILKELKSIRKELQKDFDKNKTH